MTLIKTLRSRLQDKLSLKSFREGTPPDVVIGADYLRRWWIIPRNRWFNIYLHQINHSDDDRALHDHPWWNLSIILKGGYKEVTPHGEFERHAGQIIARPGSRLHRLVIPDDSYAVTLFVTGPKYREWGFLCERGWRRWQDFCNPSDKYEVGPGCD